MLRVLEFTPYFMRVRSRHIDRFLVPMIRSTSERRFRQGLGVGKMSIVADPFCVNG